MDEQTRIEITRILDHIDFTPSGLYNSKKPMSKIVNDMRTELVDMLAGYITTNYERKPHGKTRL